MQYSKKECVAVYKLLKAEVLPAGKSLNGVNKKDMGKCVCYLMDKAKFVSRVIICTSCGKPVTYNSVKQIYRCSRRSCKRELSWTVGTFFYNLKHGLTCAHLVCFFGTRLIFNEYLSLQRVAKGLNITEMTLKKWDKYLSEVLDWWKTEFQPPSEMDAKQVDKLSGFELFVQNSSLEERVLLLFAILRDYSKRFNKDLSQEYGQPAAEIQRMGDEQDVARIKEIEHPTRQNVSSPVTLSTESVIETFESSIASTEANLAKMKECLIRFKNQC